MPKTFSMPKTRLGIVVYTFSQNSGTFTVAMKSLRENVMSSVLCIQSTLFKKIKGVLTCSNVAITFGKV